MRRFFCIFMGAMLALCLWTGAGAAEVDNTCGEGLTWVYDGGVLTITGSGDMDDLSAGAPWDGYSIQSVVLSGGVTSVGAGAFTGNTGLTAVDFGDSLREIGENAFKGCTGLTSISLPASFRLFGASCFEGCVSLAEVHCAGGMPSFRSNCLWNYGNITIYCPDSAPWSESYVAELETNFHGRLEVLTESGRDIYVWPEETTAATEAETVPTTEATTEATQAPTEAATAPTQAPTAAATQPEETAMPETTAPTTETEPNAETEPVSGLLVGVFILSGVLSLALIGVLIFRGKRETWD